MNLIDRLLHRVPWNGDRIRTYNREFFVGDDGHMISKDTFIGEFRIKVLNGNVLVLPRGGYIRGDLPKWAGRHGCWEYFYTPNGGA